METPDTGTLAWAALVAALVSLAIKYLAKPYAEVRKDRILSRHRAIRQLQREIAHFQVAAGKVRDPDRWRESPRLMRGFAREVLDQGR